MPTIHLDKILQKIGGFGRWQRVQLAFLAPSGVFFCWLNFVYIFVAPSDSNVHCVVNDSVIDNVTLENLTTIQCVTVKNAHWDFTFENRYQCAIQQICFSIGVAAGIPIFYSLSNKFGRKRTLLVSIVILTISGSVAPYSHFYALFCLMRFLTGIFAGAFRMCALLLSLETVNSRYHHWVLTIWDVAHSVGYMLLTSMAAVSEDWRMVYIVCTTPMVLLMVYIWLVPESPRWLLMRRRKADAERMLRKIAIVNGHKLRHESVKNLKISEKEVIKYDAYTFRQVLNDRKMLLWLLELLTCWFLTYTIYYILSYAIPFLDGNGADSILKLHAWAGFVEIIAILLVLITASFFSKKRSGAALAASCALCCVLTAIVTAQSSYVPVATMALVAKFFVVAFAATIQMMTLDFLPSEFRFIMVATTATVSQSAAAGSSIIAITGESLGFTPFLISGVLATPLFGLMLLLPNAPNVFDEEERVENETNGKTGTVEQAITAEEIVDIEMQNLGTVENENNTPVQ